jgi:hypothetical protein
MTVQPISVKCVNFTTTIICAIRHGMPSVLLIRYLFNYQVNSDTLALMWAFRADANSNYFTRKQIIESSVKKRKMKRK